MPKPGIGHKVALQGNLDPSVLFAGAEVIRAETMRVLASFGSHEAGVGHIFNLGHGISQFTPPEAVTTMVETVHEMSQKMFQQCCTNDAFFTCPRLTFNYLCTILGANINISDLFHGKFEICNPLIFKLLFFALGLGNLLKPASMLALIHVNGDLPTKLSTGIVDREKYLMERAFSSSLEGLH